MELLYDENLLPRILMTVTAIALAIGPAVADFNKTHATNPLWPPHARFHVVWQVITNSSLCLMMLYILWTPLVAQYNLQLILVAIVQGAILAPLYHSQYGPVRRRVERRQRLAAIPIQYWWQDR